MRKQEKTLIPGVCLLRQQAQLGRSGYTEVEWDGYILHRPLTNPEADGKQGRVMHPEQKGLRVCQRVRQESRFPTPTSSYGTPVEKYRQIGNAVPPALGKAHGLPREAAGASDVKAEK